jgi:hypothetical protein
MGGDTTRGPDDDARAPVVSQGAKTMVYVVLLVIFAVLLGLYVATRKRRTT